MVIHLVFRLKKMGPGEVDDECYGTPTHAWSEEFFNFFVLGTGQYVTIDERTTTRKAMDVAMILIRRKRYSVINFVERFEINGEMFVIKVVEDWFAPQWYSWNKPSSDSDGSSSNSDSEESQEEYGEFVNGDEEDETSCNSDEEEDAGVAGEEKTTKFLRWTIGFREMKTAQSC